MGGKGGEGEGGMGDDELAIKASSGVVFATLRPSCVVLCGLRRRWEAVARLPSMGGAVFLAPLPPIESKGARAGSHV